MKKNNHKEKEFLLVVPESDADSYIDRNRSFESKCQIEETLTGIGAVALVATWLEHVTGVVVLAGLEVACGILAVFMSP